MGLQNQIIKMEFDSNPVFGRNVFIWGEHSWGGFAIVCDHLCVTSQTLMFLPKQFKHREVATHETRAERLPNDSYVQIQST